MKKFISMIIVLVMCAATSKSQTTADEYNYIVKGYKVQMESGLDMKKGYEMKDIDNVTTDDRTVSLKAMYRVTADKKAVAAYMMIYQKGGGEKEYICIPSPKSDPEIINLFASVLYSGKEPGKGDSAAWRLRIIAYCMTRGLTW